MKPSNLLALLSQTIPAMLPVLLVGAPGVGKTSLVYEAARRAGYDVIVMHPVVSQPTDGRGIAAILQDDAGNAVAEFLPTGKLRQIVNATRPTVCFLDDLGQAPAAVQASFMHLILAREVGEHKVSDQVVFIAATNGREHRAAVSGILEPVKSRFAAIVNLEVDMPEWTEWARQHDVPGELIDYVIWRPETITTWKATPDIVNSPSPRTVAFAGQLLQLDLPEDIAAEALAGAVGQGFATEFMAFRRLRHTIPDIRQIWTDKRLPAGLATDVLVATLSQLASETGVASFPSFVAILDAAQEAYGNEYGFLGMSFLTLREPKFKQHKAFAAWSLPHGRAFAGVA